MPIENIESIAQIILSNLNSNLPHRAPSLPRNSRRFESYNALPKPESRLPMLISLLYMMWYHLSTRKKTTCFFDGDPISFSLPRLTIHDNKKEKNVIQRTSNKKKKRKRKVFYVDELQSTTYSLSCRKKGKKNQRNKWILFLHIEPQYEKKIVFFC